MPALWKEETAAPAAALPSLHGAAAKVTPYASIVPYPPPRRASCHSRLSAHVVGDCRVPLPSFAELLGLYGRGDRTPWALGRRLARPRPALALPPLGDVRFRSGAGKTANFGALAPALDLCRTRSRRAKRGLAVRRESVGLNLEKMIRFADCGSLAGAKAGRFQEQRGSVSSRPTAERLPAPQPLRKFATFAFEAHKDFTPSLGKLDAAKKCPLAPAQKP